MIQLQLSTYPTVYMIFGGPLVVVFVESQRIYAEITEETGYLQVLAMLSPCYILLKLMSEMKNIFMIKFRFIPGASKTE